MKYYYIIIFNIILILSSLSYLNVPVLLKFRKKDEMNTTSWLKKKHFSVKYEVEYKHKLVLKECCTLFVHNENNISLLPVVLL